mgnify:CR=1 FL=1|jgi:hypothetical protein
MSLPLGTLYLFYDPIKIIGRNMEEIRNSAQYRHIIGVNIFLSCIGFFAIGFCANAMCNIMNYLSTWLYLLAIGFSCYYTYKIAKYYYVVGYCDLWHDPRQETVDKSSQRENAEKRFIEFQNRAKRVSINWVKSKMNGGPAVHSTESTESKDD